VETIAVSDFVGALRKIALELPLLHPLIKDLRFQEDHHDDKVDSYQ